MKIAKQAHAIDVYQPKLDEIPGWVALTQKKQGELYEHDVNIHQYGQMQKLGKLGERIELIQVHLLLEGEDMGMKPYIAHLYPHETPRNIDRRAKDLREMAALTPRPFLEQFPKIGQDVLTKFDHLLNAAMGDMLNALREMPLLPVSTEQGAEKFLQLWDSTISEERKTRRQKGLAKPDRAMSEKMATNALIHYSREAKLKSSQEKRQFLTRVAGWYMEAEAVHGTLRAGRIPIPDGIIIKRGRPRKKPKPE